MIVVLVTVLIKAIGKIGQDFSSYNSNETLREQWRKRIETPPFPLKCCISIAYKVKELCCTVSVPFFRTSTDHFLTLHDLKNTPEGSKQAEI